MANLVFFNHGRILMTALMVGLALACIVVVCIGGIMTSLPRRIRVVTANGEAQESEDPYGDNWPKFAKYAEDVVMLPGGSEIMRGIDNNLDKLNLYNENARPQ